MDQNEGKFSLYIVNKRVQNEERVFRHTLNKRYETGKHVFHYILNICSFLFTSETSDYLKNTLLQFKFEK